jgi:hypothetical protein
VVAPWPTASTPSVVDLFVKAHQVFVTYELAQLLLGGYLTAAQRAELFEASAVTAWWRGRLRGTAARDRPHDQIARRVGWLGQRHGGEHHGNVCEITHSRV